MLCHERECQPFLFLSCDQKLQNVISLGEEHSQWTEQPDKREAKTEDHGKEKTRENFPSNWS